MPILPQPRNGAVLRIKDRPLEFSFWPVEKTTRRYGVGTRVFAADPWTVIRRSVEGRCAAPLKPAAFALLEQSQDFFIASNAGVQAAKPLVLYYCFMNLVKAFLLTTNQRQDVNDAQHGLAERLDLPLSNRELINAYLESYQTPWTNPPPPRQKINIFDELLKAIRGNGLPAPAPKPAPQYTRFDLAQLMPQVVPGHRLWAAVGGTIAHERFVAIEKIEFRQDVGTKQIWLQLYIFGDDLKRLNLGHQDALTLCRLDGLFREVECQEQINDRKLIAFQQLTPVNYNHRPSDEIPALVSIVRHLLWRTILIMPPYRRYYVYAAPVTEHAQSLPQLLSIYALTYYLGSIVRYRPHHFDVILRGEYGPFIEAFLNDQPTQFIYLMASEFAEKEVTKAALV